jgi:putative secretion ATPase (PEP-CTERM system associated)
MYDQFYQFKGRPFQLTPDPHFYFESATHRKALSYLGYGMAQGEGFIVITGEIGSGKTTLVGHVMSTIDPARLTAAKIVSSQVESDDLLRLVAQNFGIAEPSMSKAQLLQRTEAFLHAQARKGLRTLLIVDEAQALAMSAVEELRMLSNFQLGGQALLQIFLLGQPEFRDLMNSPQLEQLRQRVIATHHLEPMMASEVQAYVEHRLKLVGWGGHPRLTQDAYAAIYTVTDGVPRRVNALMSRVLLLGAVDRLSEIDGQVVNAVAADMGLDTDIAAESPKPSVFDILDEESAAPEPVRQAAGDGDAVEVDYASFTEIEMEVPRTPGPASDALDLHRVRDELEDLRRTIASTAALGGDVQAIYERLSDLERRVHSVEEQTEEHEAALRRVLTLLVEWVETEDNGARAA